MTLKRTFTLSFILLPVLFFAQTRIYLNKAFKQVDPTFSYAYYVDIYPRADKHAYGKMYDSTSMLVSEGAFSEYGIKGKVPKEEGMHRFYRPGQKKLWYQQAYKTGVMEGDLSSWYPTGEVKRIEHFHEGKSVGGECYARDGSEIPFTPFTKMPEFPGGEQALAAFWEKHLKYPDDAYDYGIEGDMKVELTVDPKGRHTITNDVQPLEFGFKNEIYRLVRKMPDWIPGRVDDEIAPLSFNFTIPFNLEKERLKRKNPPGTLKFDLIDDVINTGERFYINSYRERVNPNNDFIHSGIATKLPNGTARITFYDKSDRVISESVYADFNHLFETKIGATIYSQPDTVIEIQPGSFEYIGGNQGRTKYYFLDLSVDSTQLIPPFFKYRDIGLIGYLSTNLLDFSADIQYGNGIVIVSFLIGTDGKVSDIYLKKNIRSDCGRSLVKVISRLYNWEPATMHGKKIPVRYILPVYFHPR